MRVTTTITEIELDGDYSFEDGDGRGVPSICATCDRCENEVEVYGRSNQSARRAMILLRESCPRGENNFYADGGYGE